MSTYPDGRDRSRRAGSGARTLVAVFLCLGLGTLAPAAAQESLPDTLLGATRYLDLQHVLDPQISPDGREVVYSLWQVDRQRDRMRPAVWAVRADGSRNRFVADGEGARWAPDGLRIAYLAEAESGGQQLFVRWLDAPNAATQLTYGPGSVANPVWSPDGRWLAFTQVVPAPGPSLRIDEPAPPPGATWAEPPRVTDGTVGSSRLFLVAADGRGGARELTGGSGPASWTPDGRHLVYGSGGRIGIVDVARGVAKTLTPAGGRWSDPAVSPDGRLIAMLGFERGPEERFSYRANEVYVIGTDGSGLRRLTSLEADLRPRFTPQLFWRGDGRGVYYTGHWHGSVNLYFVPTEGGEARVLTRSPRHVTLSSLARTGQAVGIRDQFQEPGNVVRYALDRPDATEPLTHANRELLSRTRLGEVEEIWFRAGDGPRIQGWIVRPPGFDPSRKYPFLLNIHGGPHSNYDIRFSYYFQNFAANGYVVLYTNPRGSTGYGNAFGNAIYNNYPGPDYHDLMAGVDTLLGRGYIDPERMFVNGGSGGAVLTAWIVGHTDRFAAAAAMAGVYNWLSFGAVLPGSDLGWRNPKLALDHSPLMLADRVKTPVLITVGDEDRTTPPSQSLEYYRALRAAGVPTALVEFPGEPHAVEPVPHGYMGTGSRPSNTVRTQLYLLRWFQLHPRRGATP